MSSYPRTFSQVPSKEDEREIRKLELKEKYYPKRTYLADAYCGSPHCPECGLKLKTKSRRAFKPEWILQCKNFHCFLVNAENGRDRITFEMIPYHDERYPRRKINADK